MRTGGPFSKHGEAAILVSTAWNESMLLEAVFWWISQNQENEARVESLDTLFLYVI